MIESIADLIAFLKHYHRHWSIDPEAPDPSVIPDDLPPGLAAIHRELGGLIEIEHHRDGRQPFNSQDGLARVESLSCRDGGMITFAWENQGNWSARCAAGQLDPPVLSNALSLLDESKLGFIEVCPSLNHYLTTLCLQEAMYSSRYIVAIESQTSAQQATRVPLESLWLDGYDAFGDRDSHFFTTPDRETLFAELGSGLWVGAWVQDPAELIRPSIDYSSLY